MAAGTIENKIICSGALFYSKSSKRILLLQKASGKHQGTWGLVGGTNIEGETAWQGLLREVEEEIGFVPEIIKTIPLETFVSNDKVFNFHTYLCVIQDEFIPKLSEEHAGWAWSSVEFTPKPLHQGLKNSFTNKVIKAKMQTILDMLELI